MTYDIQLSFVRDLLRGLSISSHIATNPTENISAELDLGLRAMLYGTNNYAKLLYPIEKAKHNTVYRFIDEYSCNYIMLRLPKTEPYSCFFIGPYVTAPISEKRIRALCETLDKSEDEYNQLRDYYNSLPIVEDENLLFTITNTLGNTLWGSPDNYSIEYLDYIIPNTAESIRLSPDKGQNDSSFSLSVLEQNYANESMLMEAVSQGKLHKANMITSSVYNNGTEQRLADSLRNRKNYLIILNTLLRKAAQTGGVHPYQIHKISSHFAQKIENVRSINNSISLQTEMIRDYCLLVKEHSLNKYSHLVGEAITLIAYDLTADLSLKSIAKQLNVNPPYLSALFSKECGCTLTEYVNDKRIEQAIFMLSSSDKTVSAIAFECGIPDTNYFIKLFKRKTGLTPTAYRKQLMK